jgi:D-alanine-D-alanine ligase
MRIGLAFDLKEQTSAPSGPDDLQEEFDSPGTIAALAGVLKDMGHEVILLGDGPELLRRLLADPPDFVFNIAEGHGASRSREARVPAVLEMLDIPYSGSDPMTLAVALDKDCAKRLVASAGVPVPRGVVVEPDNAFVVINETLRFPVIVKPAWEGSSKGIRGRSIVESPLELPKAVLSARNDYRQPVLVEEFIQGDELTVGVLGNRPPEVLGVMRVVPREPVDRFVYSVEVKRDYERLVNYECPPPYSRHVLARIEKAALDSYRTLGCRDVARVDFRLRDGIPYFLEVNPLPGINPETSDLVILAKLRDWSYRKLIAAILHSAFDRTGIPRSR